MRDVMRAATPTRGEVGRLAFLSAEEEKSLATAWVERRDRRALDRILLLHRPMVAKMARQLKVWGQSQEDLEQDGMVGLMKAAESFDPKRGVRFSAFARHYAMAEMLASTRSLRGAVRVPISSDAASAFTGYSKAKRAWEAKHGREVDIDGLEEIARDLGISSVTAQRLEAWRSAKTCELDAPIGDEGASLIDALADEGPSQEEELLEREAVEVMVRSLAAAVAELPERDRAVLDAAYSEAGAGASTIAREMGVSHQRVGQIRQRALGRLRDALAPIRAAVDGVGVPAPVVEQKVRPKLVVEVAAAEEPKRWYQPSIPFPLPEARRSTLALRRYRRGLKRWSRAQLPLPYISAAVTAFVMN